MFKTCQWVDHPYLGIEPQTARFEVQILGEEPLRLLRCTLIQCIAFFIPFCPALDTALNPWLRPHRLLKIGLFYQGKFAILSYIAFKLV